MNKEQYVAALRELADYVESKDFPDTIMDWFGERIDSFSPPNLIFWIRSIIDFQKICSAMGTFKKEFGDGTTGAICKLPSGTIIKVLGSKENICKKVVIGTKTIPAKEEEIIPAVPEHEEEVVSWICPESFLNLEEEIPIEAKT